MATRSTIALEFADGTVQQIYCHWDGYIDHNGQILYENYTDPFKIRDLISLGDVSVLGPEIGEKHQFADAADYKGCTFYSRDRGETGTGARKFANFADYEKNHQYEEYEYILRNDANWYVSQYGRPYELLVEAIRRQEETA